ncbi:hypothetical protein [Duganella sp. Root198D2]|uniref:hypothetical protein n=1 Tax=Duganella sp. Root198D2 TaxID=1736489 RepID=UPI00070C2AF1|nr:hypothetical protein [Duganella sp. Root198D2]KRB81647.1 hypothetical protein ASE26_14990 [Duganella sp. Root198D2]
MITIPPKAASAMTDHTFKPGKKHGRNKLVGSWSESVSKKIDLPFTVESLSSVLSWAVTPNEGKISHQDVAHWCERFHMAMLDIETVHTMDVAIRVAADVDAQWGLYLANTYTLEELQNLDFLQVRLPLEWFEDWLNQLDAS